MRRFTTTSLNVLLLLSLVFSFQNVFGQTAIYTVNSAVATGGNNFQNFTDMTTHFNTNGVSSPVVVNVVPGSGPYIDTIHFKNISGTSPVNTIRVNGHGETVNFVFNNTSSNYYYGTFILKFDTTKYVTVDSLVFNVKDSGTYYYNYGGGGALISGNAAYDSITHCVFNLFSDTSLYNYNWGSRTGIVIGGDSYSYYYYYYASGGGDNCYIGYNRIVDSGGYNWNGGGWGSFGIGAFDGSDNNVIAHNDIQNNPLYGVYLYRSKNTQVLYNDIHYDTDTFNYNNYYYYYYFYGIYTMDTISGSQIVGNRIHNLNVDSSYYYNYYTPFYGLYLGGTGTDSSPVLVANNAVYNIGFDGGLYGIYANGHNNLIYHNTIDFDKNTGHFSPDYGIYVDNDGNTLMNNNVSITGGGLGLKYGFYYDDLVTDAQKNNYYVSSPNGSVFYGSYLSNNYSDITAFHAANPTLEVGSPSVDPQFIDPVSGNLNIQSIYLKAQGVPLTAVVPLDILEYTRPSLPTIGAFEAVLAMNDAAGIEFITPKDSFCSSSQPVSISIYDAGVNAIHSLQIHWTVNGVAQPSVIYNNTLNSIASTTGHYSDTVTLGNVFFSPNTATVIKAWTYLPNGVADTININDTITRSFYAISSDYGVAADLNVVCPGMDVNLTVVPDTGIVAGLTWQYRTSSTNWTDIPNSDTTKYRDNYMNTSKSYRVKINLDQACFSDTTHVTVISPHVLTTAPNGGCDSSQIILNATSNNGTELYWYDAPSATVALDSGATYTTPPLMNTTTYYVAASISGLPGCESSRQAVIAIVQHPLPDIPLHDTTVCTGDTVTLIAGDTGTSYLWNTGATSPMIAAADSGIYRVEITSFYHCMNTDSIRVNWFPLASVNGFDFIPSYNPLGTVQFSPIDPVAVDSYLWDFGDGSQGATTATPEHTYAATGDYMVSLTVTNHCRTFTVSQMIHVDLTTGIVTVKSNQSADIILYPNPSREYITLRSNNPDLGMEYITIYDMLGKKVYAASAKGQQQKQISISRLPSGMYSVKITTNKQAVIVRKFEILH